MSKVISHTIESTDKLQELIVLYQTTLARTIELNDSAFNRGELIVGSNVDFEDNRTHVKPSEPSEPQEPDTLCFRYPVDYVGIDEGFKSSHLGVDFGHDGVNINPPVKSVNASVVIGVYYSNEGAGNMVKTLRVADGVAYVSCYKHLDSIPDHIVTDYELARGDVVGYMGNTGNSNGEHLHYDLCICPEGTAYLGINSNSSDRLRYSVNPLDYLYLYPDQTVGSVTDSKYTIKRL